MDSANIFVGAHCPNCNITIGLAASVGGPINCPNCGREMVAAKDSPETHVFANVKCKNCGTLIGMMSVVGGPAKCPTCGEPL